MTYLVTGANGFVGRALVNRLKIEGCRVRGAVRSAPSSGQICVGDIGSHTDWRLALDGVDVVIHCAARAHIVKETSPDPIREYRKVNVSGTRRLAEQAAAFGAKRLIFVSSIGVNGISTDGRSAFTEQDSAMPVDAYGLSKWEAELTLTDVGERTGLEVVIVRSPLVYGPGVQASFLRLVRLVRSGIPLPFASVHNRRSLIGTDNLVDFLYRCSRHSLAPGNTFLISDGVDISTPELIRRIAAAMHRPSRLVPCSLAALRLGARLAGLSSEMLRLTSSLQIDSSHSCRTLGWAPPVSIDEGLHRTVNKAC